MKKITFLNKTILIFTILLIVFSLFSSAANALDKTYWWYTNESGAVVGFQGTTVGFDTETMCNGARSLALGTNMTLKLGSCFQQTVAGIASGLKDGTQFTADQSVAVTPKINVAENKSIYKMLVPLPGITCMDSSGKDTTCISNDIGKYLNVIFSFAIGLCAALAVIMLIIAGVSYMGDESVFGKTEAKKKMFSALLGLFIALGAWALLNTINPDLTGKNGLVIDSANVEIVPLNDRGYNDPKQANGESTNCKVVPSGPCSVANLTTVFGADKAVAMSKICSMESSGRENLASGTDYCSPPGKSLPFSFGLFQVNLSANGSLAGADCVGLFDRAVTGADAIAPKYTSGYTCSLVSGKENIYTTCVNRLLDTPTNLAIAKSLFNNSKGMGNWNGDKKYCASAFQ